MASLSFGVQMQCNAEYVRSAPHRGQHGGADGGGVPPGEHHQPGAHLRDPSSELVLRGAPGPAPGGRLPRPQLVATLIAVYAHWPFAKIKGIGWGWGAVIWLFSIVTFFPLDVFKFAIRYFLSGKQWNNVFDNKTAFANELDYGKSKREAQWAIAQRSLHGLQQPEASGLFNTDNSNDFIELSEIAEQAKRRAEIARYELTKL